MKKILALIFVISLGSQVFAQNMGIDLSLGFQYGTVRVTDGGTTQRKINEPGVLLTFRFVPDTIGLFVRAGLLFPPQILEGDQTLNYSKLNYMLFFNGGAGASFKVPINDRFSFIGDVGMSINDLFYGGTYRETIDAKWEAELVHIGVTYGGGHVFENVKMSERYNDWAIGLLANLAMRFNFTQRVYMELGAAVSFDFLRFQSYKFTANFRECIVGGSAISEAQWAYAKDIFPHARVDESAKEVIFEKTMDFSIFKQLTFIPSLSVGFSF